MKNNEVKNCQFCKVLKLVKIQAQILYEKVTFFENEKMIEIINIYPISGMYEWILLNPYQDNFLLTFKIQKYGLKRSFGGTILMGLYFF